MAIAPHFVVQMYFQEAIEIGAQRLGGIVDYAVIENDTIIVRSGRKQITFGPCYSGGDLGMPGGGSHSIQVLEIKELAEIETPTSRWRRWLKSWVA